MSLMGFGVPHRRGHWCAFVCATLVLCTGVAHAEEVRSWAYQLQGYGNNSLARIDADLVVLDVDEVRSEGVGLQELRRPGRRIVSYLSIGEAESYRGYWQKQWSGLAKPAWIDDENPSWAANYRVRYWHKEWRDLMVRAVRRIGEEGFDGVYLDTIDTWEHYKALGFGRARSEMIELVLDLSAVGKAINPDFEIIVQNATELLTDDEYLEGIDGVASEDTFFYSETRQPPAQVGAVLEHLKRARRAGKYVLTVEYGARAVTVHKWCSRALRAGFVPLVAPRALDQTINTMCTREVGTVARQR